MKRALLAKTRALFGLGFIVTGIAGCILRRFLQQRGASGPGWMLLERLGFLRQSVSQDAAPKSASAPSFDRSLRLPPVSLPVEDTDEPLHKEVQETSPRSTASGGSLPLLTPGRTETAESKTSVTGTEAAADGLASPLPAPQSLTIKLLEPALAKGEARCYWGNAQRAKAARLFTLADLTSAATVSQVKERVAVELGISPADLQLLLFGCKLKDARTLCSYGFDKLSDPLIHVLPVATPSSA